MPVAKIGLFTVVGGDYFFSRLRKNIGLYLGLKGTRLKDEEVIQAGLANFFVEKSKI